MCVGEPVLLRRYLVLREALAESLDAAVSGYARLAARVEALGRRHDALAQGSSKLTATLVALRDQLQRQREELPATPDRQWLTWPTPANGRPALQRLPASRDFSWKRIRILRKRSAMVRTRGLCTR